MYAERVAAAHGSEDGQAVVFMHKPFFDGFHRLFGGAPAIQAIGPPVMYLNSVSVPALVSSRGIREHDKMRDKPLLVKGLGETAINER